MEEYGNTVTCLYIPLTTLSLEPASKADCGRYLSHDRRFSCLHLVQHKAVKPSRITLAKV